MTAVCVPRMNGLREAVTRKKPSQRRKPDKPKNLLSSIDPRAKTKLKSAEIGGVFSGSTVYGPRAADRVIS